MALSVGVANPGKLGVGVINPAPKISGVIRATPGSNGFLGLTPPVNNVPQINAAQSQSNSMTSQINALLAAIARGQNAQPRQVYAPSLNFAGINASARSQAEGAVNPYYTKELQRFLAEQGAHKAQAEALNKTTITNLEEDLKNRMEGNAITQARTGEDVATNIADINTQADQFQTDTGQQFTSDRLQQGRDLAKAGLTGGLGAQQAEAAQTARNTTEERATAKTDQEKQKQELFKARTFEDLSRSNVLGTQSKERGVKAANVDLADFITNQGFETEKTTSGLEKQRLEDLAAKERAYRGIGVAQAVEAIADPAQRNAARQAYGGYL